MYGLRAYGFDPTRKHHAHLDSIVNETNGKFKHYRFAISDTDESRVFYETLDNVSGSFFSDHENIRRDTTRSYEVRTITLDGIFDLLGVDQIDIMKMDIEGGEYSTLSAVSKATFRKIDQMAVEFHHHCVNQFSFKNTKDIIQTLQAVGFESYTTDSINYLFFHEAIRCC
jgi:FkbM family methyltransferase